MAARTWSEWFWLPEGHTWKQVEEKIGSDYPDINQFFMWGILFSFLCLILRNYILIPFLLEPLGRRAGIRDKPYPHPPPNEELEVLYKINRARPPRRMLVDAAAKIDWTERKVERWLRLKALSMQLTTLQKFCDHGWQTFFYSCFLISGLFVIVPQTYFWNPLETMENLPYERLPSSVWWYSVVTCGFYISQIVILFSQGYRTGFYMVLSHHIVCLVLMYICLTMNIMKLSSLTAFIHENVDVPLGLGKMLGYAKKGGLNDIIFIIFVIVWVCSRLIAFPLMAMRPPLVAYREFSWPGMFCFKIFGFSFFFLHILWTVDIVKSIKNRLTADKITDSRSSPDEMSEEDEPVILKDKVRTKEQVHGAHSSNIARLRK